MGEFHKHNLKERNQKQKSMFCINLCKLYKFQKQAKLTDDVRSQCVIYLQDWLRVGNG